jgi:hypothetical protein
MVAEDDGRAEPQGMKLPGRLQDARFLAFWKNHPFRMPLQFFDDVADKTHGDRLAVSARIAKSICRWNRSSSPSNSQFFEDKDEQDDEDEENGTARIDLDCFSG